MNHICRPILLTLSLSIIANASVSYDFHFRQLRDQLGSELPDTTLVVLIADTDTSPASLGLPGGLNDDDLTQSGIDPAAAFSHFNDQTLSVGDTINGDTVFHIGRVNADNFFFPAGSYYAPGTNFNSYPGSVAGGQNFGIYWFPGRAGDTAETLAAQKLPATPFQMGGFFNAGIGDQNGEIGMTLLGTDALGPHKVNQLDTDSSIEPAAMTAILVPEPSAALLSLLGLGLLRRRR